MSSNGYHIRLLDRVVAILDCFQNDKSPLGVTELSKKLGLHKSTVHRLLESLTSYRLITQDAESEKYSLGLKLFELGSRAVSGFDVHEKSKAVLEQLVSETGETAHLCILDGEHVLYLEKFESAKTLRIPSRVGLRNPAYCTAVGKALLAYLPDEPDRLFKGKALKRYTENTITDLAKLRQELALVRERGYSFDNEEIEAGLRCVGAPVRDYTGRAIAAISIAGPSFRITPGNIPSLSESVRKAANSLSEQMGYRAEYEPVGKTRNRARKRLPVRLSPRLRRGKETSRP